jgi:hypothetical protein
MRLLFAVALFVAGYLVGTLEWPTHAQAPVQGFNSDGSSWTYFPPAGPGAPGQWFGSNGQSGTVFPPPAPLPGLRSPC